MMFCTESSKAESRAVGTTAGAVEGAGAGRAGGGGAEQAAQNRTAAASDGLRMRNFTDME
jgi:hypothetical protein